MLHNSVGSTALHVAIDARNDPAFEVILRSSDLDLDVVNNEGCSVLELALRSVLPTADAFDDDSFASKLVQRGASVDAVDTNTGLIHCLLIIKIKLINWIEFSLFCCRNRRFSTAQNHAFVERSSSNVSYFETGQH